MPFSRSAYFKHTHTHTHTHTTQVKIIMLGYILIKSHNYDISSRNHDYEINMSSIMRKTWNYEIKKFKWRHTKSNL